MANEHDPDLTVLRSELAQREAEAASVSRSAAPLEWAEAQRQLGIAWALLAPVDGVECLWKAIGCYEAGLGACTAKDAAKTWGELQIGLAGAWERTPSGDVAADLERAVECCFKAQGAFDPRETSLEWCSSTQAAAWILRRLAVATGHAPHTRRAIRCYEQIIAESELENDDWGIIHQTMGRSWMSLGESSETNRRRARKCYEAGLTRCSREEFPEIWAELTMSLADCHCLGGNGRKVKQKALEYYQQALFAISLEKSPLMWAMAHNNSAGCLEHLAEHHLMDEEKHEAYLLAALESYLQALPGYVAAERPESAANAHDSIGAILLRMDRIDRNREDDLAEAMEHFTEALKVFRPESRPDDWAMTHWRMAECLGEMERGDRRENLRRSLEHLGRVHEVFTRESAPGSWASVHFDMATRWHQMDSEEDHAGDLRRVLFHLDQVQMVCDLDSRPETWAAALGNRASTLVELSDLDGIDRFEEAIASLEMCLEFYTELWDPDRWALKMTHLGDAWARRPGADRLDHLRTAIGCYEETLRVYTSEDAPDDWASARCRLAAAWHDLAQLDGKVDGLWRALRCLRSVEEELGDDDAILPVPPDAVAELEEALRDRGLDPGKVPGKYADY